MKAACIYEPAYLFRAGKLVANEALGVDEAGQVVPANTLPRSTPRLKLSNRVLLPGLVNAHSHAFQRLIRGRTELAAPGSGQDDFWSWRERMYQAAEALDPDGIYIASRQAFLEMALAGITTVGEFHYVHHQADGTPYEDPDTLALAVVLAARDVGLRITLLRVGYARAGFEVAPNPRQRRFYDKGPDAFLRSVSRLMEETLAQSSHVRVGIAPHSVRAVPKAWLEALKDAPALPLHMHVAEQPAEVAASQHEHGMRPVALLDSLGLLSPRFTAVHGVHLDEAEIAALGRARAHVCACPSTEQNLGDGIVPADALLKAGVRMCLGTDSQASIDLLGEARALEGNLRLLRQKRAVLDEAREGADAFAGKLLHMATAGGAESLGWPGAPLEPGSPADFFTLDLGHPAFAGLDERQPLASVLWSSGGVAARDVVVQGRHIVSDGHHSLEDDSTRDFGGLAKRVFG